MPRRDSGSTPLVGSSRNTILGSPMSAQLELLAAAEGLHEAVGLGENAQLLQQGAGGCICLRASHILQAGLQLHVLHN